VTLEQVERARDQWQRPSEIIQKLNLRGGNVVVDIGSGVGYFTFKLSHVVGKSGKVLPVDIKEFPLCVLRTRGFLMGDRNIDAILAEPDDPHLPPAEVDAVLVLNTYHELTHPALILDQLSRSLKPGGHLVIVDGGPSAGHETGKSEDHAVASEEVEATLRRRGFEVLQRHDQFTQQPGDGRWWIILARKPPKAGGRSGEP